MDDNSADVAKIPSLSGFKRCKVPSHLKSDSMYLTEKKETGSIVIRYHFSPNYQDRSLLFGLKNVDDIFL